MTEQIIDANLPDFPPGTRVLLQMADARRFVVDLKQLHPFFVVAVFWGEWSQPQGQRTGHEVDGKIVWRVTQPSLEDYALTGQNSMIRRGQTVCWPISQIAHITSEPAS